MAHDAAGEGRGGVTTPGDPNQTDSQAMAMPQATYSTALGVTIAVGCSLLILNVLIFAGVYYQRDKGRATDKGKKRPFEVSLAGAAFKEKKSSAVFSFFSFYANRFSFSYSWVCLGY